MAQANHFSLPVKSPFDWESLLAFLRARATPGVETVTESAYERTLHDDGSPQTLRVTYDRPGTRLNVDFSSDVKEARLGAAGARVQQIFKTDVPTDAIETFLGRSGPLAAFVRRQPGLRVPGGWCAFEVAARAVLGQQISVAAATTLMGRLVKLAGTRINETAWLFPTAGRWCEPILRSWAFPDNGARR